MRCGDHPHLPPTNPLPLPPAGGCCPHFVPGRSSRDDPDQPLVGAGEPPGVRRPAARWLRVVVAVVQAGTGSQADGGQLLQGQAGHVAVAADPSAGELGGPAAGAGELAGAQPGLAAGRALRAAGAGGEAAVQPARAELVGVAGVVSLRTQGRPRAGNDTTVTGHRPHPLRSRDEAFATCPPTRRRRSTSGIHHSRSRDLITVSRAA
jgi:hypothetical protein